MELELIKFGFSSQSARPLLRPRPASEIFGSRMHVLIRLFLPGSPSDMNTGNGIEGAVVCTSLGSLLGPLFDFLYSNLKANPVCIQCSGCRY